MKNLKELNQEELQSTNGGILPVLIIAAEVYLGVCAGAAAAGAGTAFIQNQYDKYFKQLILVMMKLVLLICYSYYFDFKVVEY